MDYLELFHLSLEALKSNLIRTVLTMLGVIIGIASVIIIMSLGEGATQSIVDQIQSFGANILTVQAGRFMRGPGSAGGTVDTLVPEDVTALKNVPNIVNAVGIVSTNKTVTYNGSSTQGSLLGTESIYAAMHSLNLSQGSYFTDSQVGAKAKVVVLGDEVVEAIFGENSKVVGESVRIDGKSFRIIGVAVDSNNLYLPLKTLQSVVLSQTYLNSIELEVSSSDLVETTEPLVEDVLLLRHEIKNANQADFSLRSSQEMASSISSVTGTLTALLSGIAAISLVVGGIGIMNIMLVTVTERTKEIGLLKAIGAKRRDILTQFLIEAIVVTVLGGLIGMILGVLITYVATTVIDIPFIISFSAIALAVGVSVAVGIIFGYYPASKAAKLNPIDALRYE